MKFKEVYNKEKIDESSKLKKINDPYYSLSYYITEFEKVLQKSFKANPTSYYNTPKDIKNVLEVLAKKVKDKMTFDIGNIKSLYIKDITFSIKSAIMLIVITFHVYPETQVGFGVQFIHNNEYINIKADVKVDNTIKWYSKTEKEYLNLQKKIKEISDYYLQIF